MSPIGDPIVIGGPISFFPPGPVNFTVNQTSALILPALSKGPQINSVLKYDEQSALSDPMEAGYVQSRPRFTRVRRTWSVSYRGLNQLDINVLDFFTRIQAVVGAMSFWLPNQLFNGGFETVADVGSGDIVKGWAQASAPNGLNWTNRQEQNPANTFDGGNAMLLSFNPGQQVPVGQQIQTVIGHRTVGLPYPVQAGETYLGAGRFLISNSLAFPVNVSGWLVIVLTVDYDDGTSDTAASGGVFSQSVAGWQELTCTLTVNPAKNPVALTLTIQHGVVNSSGGTWNMPAQGTPFDVRADQCGIALIGSPRPSGAIAGATAIPALVRFSKAPQHAQVAITNLGQTFTSAFEVTEV